MTHLVSRLPRSSRAGKAFGATSAVIAAGIPSTSGAPSRSQVSAGFSAPTAKERRAHGVAWASAMGQAA